MFALNLSNIFLMLVYCAGFLFGIGKLAGVMVYLLILEIFLAGTFCYFFLGSFSFSERSKLIASYLYGLSGYLLIWGQHYQFGAFLVFLPLLLLLLERAVRKERFSLTVPLLVAVMVCASVYMSYMTLLFAGFYLIFRMLQLKQKFRMLLVHCCSMVLGIGIGSFIFVPMACYLMTISSRLDSGAPFLERIVGYLSLFAPTFYKTVLLRLFSTTFQGINSYRGVMNFYEAPVLFFSALSVFLFLQYLFTIHRQDGSRKAKLLQYLAVLFFCFCFLIRFGAAAFNLFAYPFARHAFILTPVFAVITAYTLDQLWIRRRFSIMGLLLYAAMAVYAHRTALHTLTEDGLREAVVPFFICALLITLIVTAGTLIRQEKLQKLFSVLLLLTVTVNVSLEGYLVSNEREMLTTTDASYWGGLHNPNITEVMSDLRSTNDSVFRLEKDYFSGSFCMDGLAQNYRGISTYNSTPNKNLEEFIHTVIPNFPLMINHEYTYRQIGYYTGHSELFGIRYLLSQKPDLLLNGYTLSGQYGDLYLYENESVDSIARFYTQTGDSSILNGAYGTLDLERMLLETLLLDYSGGTAQEQDGPAAALNGSVTVLSDHELTERYSLEEIPLSLPDLTADGSKGEISFTLDRTILDPYERVYLEFDAFMPVTSDITVNPDQPLEFHFRVESGQTQHIQLTIPKSYDSIELSRYGGSLKGSITNLRLLGSRETVSQPSDALVTLKDSGTDSLLTGTVSTAERGFLFLPVPYENGWSAEVDGEEVRILRADLGFMCIPVEAGEHTYTFTYQQPYMQTGIWISVLSSGIWILLAVLRRRQTQKQQKQHGCQAAVTDKTFSM